MKLVMQVKLLPTPEQADALKATLHTANRAADWVSRVTFEQRCLSWQIAARTVSIWTVRGRLKQVAFTASAAQLATLAAHRKGESDLVCRDGTWYLLATCDFPDVPATVPSSFLGVDLGIADIAATSDGHRYSGKRLNARRRRQQELRRRLQTKAQ